MGDEETARRAPELVLGILEAGRLRVVEPLLVELDEELGVGANFLSGSLPTELGRLAGSLNLLDLRGNLFARPNSLAGRRSFAMATRSLSSTFSMS